MMPRPLTRESQLKSYYAARAAEYDRIYEKPERQSDITALKASLPSRFEGNRVVEVACGTGFWTQTIAPVASKVTAFDAVPETLDIARQRINAENVTFIVGDAFAPPIDHGLHDIAFVAFWFSHVPIGHQRDFLKTLASLLCPEGKVLLLDNLFVPGSSSPLADTDEAGNTYQLRRLDDGSTYRVIKNFPSEASLTQLISGLGKDAVYGATDYYWTFEYSIATT